MHNATFATWISDKELRVDLNRVDRVVDTFAGNEMREREDYAQWGADPNIYLVGPRCAQMIPFLTQNPIMERRLNKILQKKRIIENQCLIDGSGVYRSNFPSKSKTMT